MLCPRCKSPITLSTKICGKCGLSISSAMSRPLPSTDSPDSCKYCGHPLAGKNMCELCGAPAISAQPAADKLRCPICGGELGDDMACPKCGSIVGGEATEEESKIQCPKCGAKVSIDNESCGSCGIRIWMDESTESARLDALRCPACGNPAEEGEAECKHCGFLIWLETEEDRRDKAKEVIEETESTMARLQEENGVLPQRAMMYIEAARRVFEGGEAELAVRRALIAKDIAETESRQKAIFAMAVKRAEDKIKSAEDRGGDTSKCLELLQLSRQADDKGDRKMAIRLALKCKIMAESLEGSLSRTPIGG